MRGPLFSKVWKTVAWLLAGAALAAEPPLGVTSSGSTTTLRVWAPQAASVQVIGDFNHWQARAGETLARDAATGIWSVTLNRSLPRGGYQFVVNGRLVRRDPYARAVSADQSRSLFYDPSAFNWNDDRPPAQDPDSLVIYELHAGTFNDPDPRDGRPGTFYDALRRLDHLVELGVNVVELMPVHEFPGQHSWGYNPCDLFAVEQAYGGPDGLKAFVQACHSRGLAVHLDIVHNHYGPDNLDLLQFDGSGGARSGGPYFFEGPGIDMTPWGPRVKTTAAEVRRFVRDNAVMWLDEYHVDGFRWDSTINIRAYNNGANPIPAGAAMLDEINTFLRTNYPRCLSIAEDALDIGNFPASWDYDFHHQVMPALAAREDAGRDLYAVAGALARRPGMRRVIYTDNHDEAGKINGQLRTASDVDTVDPHGAYARRICGLAAVLTLTAPGIPLLFMGNEMQEDGAFHDNRPLNWENRVRHAGLVNLHRDLIRLRRDLGGAGPGLRGLEIELPVVDHDRKWLVYWRWHRDRPADRFVVAMNLSGKTIPEAEVPFPAAGNWATRLNTEWTVYGGAAQELKQVFNLQAQVRAVKMALAPYSARIFSLAQRPAPDDAAPEPGPAETAATQPAPSRPPYSMYSEMHLVGDFNGWALTAGPMRLTGDYTWEEVFTFTNGTTGQFKLSANQKGQVFWGAGYDALVTVPFRGWLKRLGPPLQIAAPMDGRYQVRFNEETLELVIEAAAPAPATPEFLTDLHPYRTWTDVRNRQVEARLVNVSSNLVTLERPTGQRLEIYLDRLVPADADYAREAARQGLPEP